jgi:hypothetical protein
MTTSKEALRRIVEAQPLSGGLRQASFLAQDQDAPDFRRWLRLELGGYLTSNSAMQNDVEVPEYRSVVGVHYDLYGRPLILPADLSFIGETRLRNGIEELEGLATGREKVIIHDPTMCQLIREHLNIEVYSFHFSAIHLRGILGAVRTELEGRLSKLNLPESGEERLTAPTAEVFQLRPNFHGIGVDLRALWWRWRGPK